MNNSTNNGRSSLYSEESLGRSHLDNVNTTVNIPTENNLPQRENTSINMEGINMAPDAGGNTGMAAARNMQRNFLTLLNEARSHLGRQTSYPGALIQQMRPMERPQFSGASGRNSGTENAIPLYRHNSDVSSQRNTTPHSPNNSANHLRSWRMNLNNVFSFSPASSTEALRSFITHSGNFRYTPLATNDSNANSGDGIHLLFNHGGAASATAVGARGEAVISGLRLNSRASRSSSLREEEDSSVHNQSQLESDNPTSSGNINTPPTTNSSLESPSVPEDGNLAHNHIDNANANADANADIDDESNVVSEIFVKVLTQFVRYLPIICLLLVKSIHDHLLGILDLLLLHCIMYLMNKSIREQVAKLSQKRFGILFRDFSLVTLVIAYRFVLAASTPDPLGLMISPPSESITIQVSSVSRNGAVVKDKASAVEALTENLGKWNGETPADDGIGHTVTITKAISLGLLLYYVAVNDLVLKLLTILIKISITMMPTRVIRHKPRARMYVLIEYISQFYRAMAPVHQWLIYFFQSYSGLEVISGILFSSFYMGAKGFEFIERGKSLKKALINFIRNMDYERKPTKEELDAASANCPICHDTYNTPIVLECNHIFCDDCVSTWFKREQTCPMCRAKISVDPTWQDGSTTFFYQLC